MRFGVPSRTARGGLGDPCQWVRRQAMPGGVLRLGSARERAVTGRRLTISGFRPAGLQVGDGGRRSWPRGAETAAREGSPPGDVSGFRGGGLRMGDGGRAAFFVAERGGDGGKGWNMPDAPKSTSHFGASRSCRCNSGVTAGRRRTKLTGEPRSDLPTGNVGLAERPPPPIRQVLRRRFPAISGQFHGDSVTPLLHERHYTKAKGLTALDVSPFAALL
jgi:hypothetical protein